jgi:geranylgeranyl pyrophosphate synthase
MAGPGYAPYLREVNEIMLCEMARWRSVEISRLWALAQAQVQRPGKQFRPLLTLMMADYLGGEPRLAVPAAASVEFYHLASLVLDDVQDHSEIRRGEPAVNAVAGPSTAVNVALFLRSLSYHVVNRCAEHDPVGALSIHRELDHAATLLILGQSMDIGWHENWYGSYQDFPYQKMIDGKSGALFGCAAAVGACMSKTDSQAITAAREYGTAFGALYQLVDDYLDVFGDETALRRPRFDDFREGKLSAPVICLLAALEERGRENDVERVLTRLAKKDRDQGWKWLLDLMHEHDVAGTLGKKISEGASRLADPAIRPDGGRGTGGFGQLVERVAAPACQE